MRNKIQRSIEEKLSIVLEGIKNETSVSEICRKHSISQSLYYKWRDKFIEGGKQALQNGLGQKMTDQYMSKVSELEPESGKKLSK